jgi:hypothetical protein
MSKRTRQSQRAAAGPGEVGARQPCPCGSGRRYKACHGSAAGPPPRLVTRPFEGLAAECDLVALRELVPAASAPLPLREGTSERTVLVCSLLPAAAPAVVRQDGEVWLGLQVQHGFGDPSRDLSAVLLRALDAQPGEVVGLTSDPGEGPRLQDLVVADTALDVTVHDGFDFWLADPDDAAAAASLERANAAVHPTARLMSVRSAYWTNVGSKEHLRWVLPYAEDAALDALARLHAAGDDRLVADGRLVGMFRAHGLLIPVWDLPVGTGPEALEDPAADFAQALLQVLDEPAPLTPAERSARHGLAHRQVTIR